MHFKRYPSILTGESGPKKVFLKPLPLLQAAGLKAGDRVVDLGSGGGYFTLPAAEIVGLGGRVFAVDHNGEVLSSLIKSATAEGLRNIQPLAATFDVAPGEVASPVDWVILSRVLSMTADPAGALEVAATMVGKSGRVLAIEWQNGLLFSRPGTSLSEEEAQRLASRAGLSVVARPAAGGYHWALVLRVIAGK